jgi:hypothetical protein
LCAGEINSDIHDAIPDLVAVIAQVQDAHRWPHRFNPRKKRRR